ncbi:hypothetical protein L6452_02877 [Arctium lappa]|uniref:Uncharacterized protein n=1 Tax=Arctium lappa TaxID=4217 RepID=A0ACB9FLI3_ARCLA|nr:hypothetical protein L6452_02877 [Arctium lappa]
MLPAEPCFILEADSIIDSYQGFTLSQTSVLTKYRPLLTPTHRLTSAYPHPSALAVTLHHRRRLQSSVDDSTQS